MKTVDGAEVPLVCSTILMGWVSTSAPDLEPGTFPQEGCQGQRNSVIFPLLFLVSVSFAQLEEGDGTKGDIQKSLERSWLLSISSVTEN